jgi:hypothetical protein
MRRLLEWVLVGVCLTAPSVAIAQDIVNHDTVVYEGGTASETIITGNYTNYGSVTGIGSSTSEKSGLTVNKDFTNYGTMTATGANQNYTKGIHIAGSLTNYGVIDATSGNGEQSQGIWVAKDFTNSGVVVATSGSGGTYRDGIYAKGTVVNTGTLIATGANDMYTGGIRIDTGFTNNALLVLADGKSVYSGKSTTFAAGSTLALADGYIDVSSQSVTIETGAQAISLPAAALAANGQWIGTYMTNAQAGGGLFDNYSTATLNYVFTANSGPVTSRDATVTRTAYASALATGSGAALLQSMENAFQGMSTADLVKYNPYAMLLSYADHQQDAQGVKRAANRLNKEMTPQGLANLLPSLARSTRVAADLFADGVNWASLMETDDDLRTAVASSAGSAYASISADACRSLYFWAKPLYFHGDLDGDNGYSDQRENEYGGSLGAAWRRDRLTLGFSGHYLRSDVDGGYAYDADYDGYGGMLGGAYRFDAGRFGRISHLLYGFCL